jgi:hypothetical protein
MCLRAFRFVWCVRVQCVRVYVRLCVRHVVTGRDMTMTQRSPRNVTAIANRNGEHDRVHVGPPCTRHILPCLPPHTSIPPATYFPYLLPLPSECPGQSARSERRSWAAAAQTPIGQRHCAVQDAAQEREETPAESVEFLIQGPAAAMAHRNRAASRLRPVSSHRAHGGRNR